MHLRGLFGEVGGKTEAKDGVKVGIKERFELGRKLCEEVETPLVTGAMAALDEVVISFIGEEAVGASVIVAGLSGVQAAADRELFPAELRKECLGSRVF